MASILFAIFLGILSKVRGETYSVKIDTESHVNLIDPKFLSFTIDPKYLFSGSEKYRSKECICMASSLTPAYIRIAGPSTAHLAFYNATIAIQDLEDLPGGAHFHDDFADNFSNELSKARDGLESRFKRNHEKVEVSHREWRKFVSWAQQAGFELVFALNDQERTSSGLWDPNTALHILTVAEKARVGHIYWQLGYECRNQSIEEYLNDLETLGVIIETFGPGRAGQWRVVGGDVTHCLQEHSKSDFKDYITLSNDIMDAILLNGNSSTQELERMSERDRLRLLRLLGQSSTPLWLTEAPGGSRDELARAADWLVGLGHAARNGFSHHFRELGDEMDKPSLSFYMALLFKNLVGSKVLNVNMDPDQAIIFAHCTSLRHKAVPGAVTLYGVNMDVEPARFSIKLDKREEAGDIMQFILSQDSSGNILVNGRSMYFEGDLKPAVKRIRPYKTLLLNLPARSFGFWVLANTKVNACYDEQDDPNKDYEETLSTESEEYETFKVKRSVIHKDFDEYASLPDVSVDFFDENDVDDHKNNLKSRINDIKENLNKVQKLNKDKPQSGKRLKRQINTESLKEKLQKLRNRGLVLRKINKKGDETESKYRGIFPNILKISKRNITRRHRNSRPRISRLPKSNIYNRNKKTKTNEFIMKAKKNQQVTERPTLFKSESTGRSRRSVDNNQIGSVENEIEVPKDSDKLWKVLRKIHKELKDISDENSDIITEDAPFDPDEENAKEEDEDMIETETGFIKSTVVNLMRVLSDLNKNLSRFWNGIKLLD